MAVGNSGQAETLIPLELETFELSLTLVRITCPEEVAEEAKL